MIFLLAAIMLIASQVAAEIPPGQGSGPEGQRVYKQFEKRKELLEKKKVKAPEIKIETEREPPAPAGVTFVLKEAKLNGSTIFKPADLQPIYQPYLDKKVSFQDIDEITKKIEDQYVLKGYLSANVFIPEQEIRDGKIELKVVEGALGKIVVEGNKWFSSALIEKFLHIKKNEPINIPKLQKDILRLNQNPDLEVKTLLQPGELEGTTDIVLRASESFPYHFGVGLDNQGTRLTGKYRTSFYARSSNLTGHLDSLFLSNILSADTVGAFAGYTFPVDTYGTKIGMDMTYFTSTLGKELRSYHVTGVTQIYNPYVAKELFLSENFQANGTVGIEIKTIKKKIAGTPTTNDQLRLPYLGFDFNKMDSFGGGGETTLSPRFIFGTSHFLGASSRNHPSASREGTGGFFFKYEQYLRRLQRMFWESYISMKSFFQAATHTLPSSEQCQLGGINSVRGYPEGDYLCDLGGSVSADWIFPTYFIPRTWKIPGSDTFLRRQLEPFVFTDVGLGKLNKVLQGEREHKFLLGAGGGFQFHFNKNFYIRLQWAKALGDDPIAGAGASTFYISCQVEI